MRLKLVSVFLLIIFFKPFSTDVYSQKRPLPIAVSFRSSILQGSYVLQLQNTANENLNLWLQAKGKISQFTITAGKSVNFGWLQGYRFDANNRFSIWGDEYDTLKYNLPNTELSPWRISFPNDGGLALSFSQTFVQGEMEKYLKAKLPINLNSSRIIDISLNQLPQIVFIEGTDRIYANIVFQASIFSSKIHFPINVYSSCIPFYDKSNGQIEVNQIKVENININGIPEEYLHEATKVVDAILPLVFNQYVIIKLKKEWQLKITRLVNLRTRVNDGRLEAVIF